MKWGLWIVVALGAALVAWTFFRDSSAFQAVDAVVPPTFVPPPPPPRVGFGGIPGPAAGVYPAKVPQAPSTTTRPVLTVRQLTRANLGFT